MKKSSSQSAFKKSSNALSKEFQKQSSQHQKRHMPYQTSHSDRSAAHKIRAMMMDEPKDPVIKLVEPEPTQTKSVEPKVKHNSRGTIISDGNIGIIAGKGISFGDIIIDGKRYNYDDLSKEDNPIQVLAFDKTENASLFGHAFDEIKNASLFGSDKDFSFDDFIEQEVAHYDKEMVSISRNTGIIFGDNAKVGDVTIVNGRITISQDER